jgi:hypothetical protein
MKHIRLSIVASAILLTGTFAAKAQSADEIVQKHITAVGGADNWKKIKSVKMTASINGGGMEIPISITTVVGKAQKTEFTLNGMTGYQIITTKEGWSYSPFQGETKPQPMTAEDVKESQDELDINELVDYKTKGSTVTFLGKDDLEGTECYKLKMVCKNGKEKTMYIDASNYYNIRTVEKAKANGKEVEQKITFSNFQKLPEGVVFPMSMESPEGPLAIKKVEINTPVDEAIFKPSEAKGAGK